MIHLILLSLFGLPRLNLFLIFRTTKKIHLNSRCATQLFLWRSLTSDSSLLHELNRFFRFLQVLLGIKVPSLVDNDRNLRSRHSRIHDDFCMTLWNWYACSCKLRLIIILFLFFFLSDLIQVPFLCWSPINTKLLHCFPLNLRILCERIIILSNWLAELDPLFFCFEESLVLLILLVTSDAAKVGLKTITRTLGTLLRMIWLVFCVGMFAYTTRLPVVDIKALSSDEPPLSNFFRSSWNKRKLLTFTILATRIEFFASDLLIMFTPETTTEASRHRPNSKAIICGFRTPPCNIYAVHLRFLSMLKLPSHHLGSARSWTNLSYNLKNGFFIISLR